MDAFDDFCTRLERKTDSIGNNSVNVRGYSIIFLHQRTQHRQGKSLLIGRNGKLFHFKINRKNWLTPKTLKVQKTCRN